MTHRKFILFLGAYVAATALFGWLAYFLGSSQGLNAAPLPADPRERAAVINNTENVWSCDLFRGFPGMRGNMMERACGEGSPLQLGAPGARGGAHDGSRPRLAGAGALDRAVALKIAGAGKASTSRLDVPPATTTLDAALNQPAPLGAMLAQASGNGLAPPPAGLPTSLPNVLVGGPGFPTFTPPDAPPPDVPEVPLPAGLPLMLTGLGGVLALARRRRAAA